MRINSVYISAFGGIKDRKIDFGSGFNVIYGDNENGKSTLMSFIKMMFYGSERGSAQLAKNIRKKMSPWDGSPMAGSIEFEHSGRRYRLEREFRTSNSTDRVTLFDLDLGESKAVPGDLGRSFFGLSAAAFERSVFIGQSGFPESDAAAESEINAKLSNIALTGDESISYDTVFSRLEKAKTALKSKSGRAGEYDKNLKVASELKSRLEAANGQKQQAMTKISELKAINSELQGLEARAAELKERLADGQNILSAKKMQELLGTKAELDALNEGLLLSDGSVADDMYLRKLNFCIGKLKSASQKAEAKRAEAESLKRSIDAGLNPPEDANPETRERLNKELEQLKAQKEQVLSAQEVTAKEKAALSAEPPQKNATVFLVTAVALFFAAIILVAVLTFVTKAPLNFAIALPFAVSGAVLTVIYFKARGKAVRKAALRLQKEQELTQREVGLKEQEKRLNSEIFDKTLKAEAINTALSSSAAVVENQLKQLSVTEAEVTSLNSAEALERQELAALFGKYRSADSLDRILELTDELARKIEKQKQLKERLRYISQDLGGMSCQEAAEKLKGIDASTAEPAADFEKLNAEYQAVISEITDKKTAAATLMAELKSLQQRSENPEKLYDELELLNKKIESQQEFCEVADIAMQALADSFVEVRRGYGSVLESKAGEIFARITNGKYGQLGISKSFDITVTQNGAFGSRELAYLSSGACDQAYLSLRLALSQLICGGTEPLPVMLDDALTQYDDSRMKTALEFLSEYSKEYQIIMFTCHKVIAGSAEALGAKLQNIKKGD